MGQLNGQPETMKAHEGERAKGANAKMLKSSIELKGNECPLILRIDLAS